MRIDVKKFLFIGIESDRAAFFKKAQEAGIIDFISEKGKTKELSADINNMISAIKILRGLPTAQQEELEEYALADGLAYKILQIKNNLGKLFEEKRIIQLEIARVGIFGDFSLEDIAFIEREGQRKIQFYFSKHAASSDLLLPPEVIYVGTEHELDYFIAINKKTTQYPKLVEMRIERALGTLKQQLANIEKEIYKAEESLKPYAKYNTFLHHALVNKFNTYNLNTASNSVKSALDDSLFVVSGWVPVNKLHQLNPLVNEMDVHAEEIAIESTDHIPTYLENHGLNRLGEDLIHIYDTPSPTDKDPSLWVLLSFALFFSFIIGDGGYGLIFLGIALYIRYKYSGIKGAGKRILNLFTLLCFGCIVWGFLTSSFFGINISPDNPLRKYSAIQWLVEKKAAWHIAHQDSVYTSWTEKLPELKGITDASEFVKKASTKTENGTSYDLISKFSDNIMIELALLIGVVHILLSMFRYLPRNWTMLGWIAFVIGGYLYIPHYLGAASMTQYLLGIEIENAAKNGLYLLIGGIGLAVIISIFKNKLLGLLEAMTAIQVFSDILSYLRLYALGLSGAILGATINESAAALPFVVSTLLIIIGHGINILLSIMSGTIHGLRLNFLEWYHYSFEGGGKMFKPLHKMKVE